MWIQRFSDVRIRVSLYHIRLNEIMGAASYQGGVAAVIPATDFQMKGELCLEPAVLFRRVVSYNRRLIPPFFYA